MITMYLSVLLALTALPAVADQPSTTNTFMMATEEYPPFTSSELKHYGVINHIVSEAFKLEGIEVKYHFYPAARSFKMAQKGQLDGTVPWAERADRHVDFFYSDPIMDLGHETFFYKQELQARWDPSRQNYASLKGLRIGAINAYDYGEKFQAAESQGVIQVVRQSTIKQLFAMLISGHVDMIISKKWVALYALQSEFSPDDQALIGSIPENTHPPDFDYILFPKTLPASQRYLQAFNRGLSKLKQDGKIESFMDAFKRGEYLLPEK